ncbi:MAG TPA: hypothetical protein PKL70_18525 [Saprospiraceae bacterium]|nr:hypothetical protein [Saprospiraceae bacterium]
MKGLRAFSERWNYRLVVLVLFAALLAEVLSITFWMQTLSIGTCRWIHFISGGVAGLTILFAAQNKTTPQDAHQGISMLLLILLFAWSAIRLYPLFDQNPLDHTKADMLPVIKVMAQRFLHWEKVYALIPEIWSGVMPVYMPALWLPFVPAVAAGLDLRWTSLVFLFLALVFLFRRVRANAGSLLVFLPAGLWMDYQINNRNETFVWSQEGVVYAYYILLVLGLYLKSHRLTGIVLACCLLSRYGILFYTGALFLCFYLFENRRAFFQIFISASVTGIVLFTISGAWSYIPEFIRLPGVYLENLQANPVKYHDLMKDALGFVPWSDPASYTSLYRWMVFLLISLACWMVYLYKKNPHPFVLLGLLKLSLVLFYHFIPIPYTYLFHTSVWVSMAIFFVYCSQWEENVYNFTE